MGCSRACSSGSLIRGVVGGLVGRAPAGAGRRRRRASTAEGAGSAAVIGVFLLVVGALALFATALLAVVPGAPGE